MPLGKLVLPLRHSMRKGRPSTLIFLVSIHRFIRKAPESYPLPPEYIAQAPWYLDTGAPSLSHQRIPEYDRSADKLDNWYDRGAKAGPAAKKYRKGACENCGAMSHKKQDCLERPRKKGAKFTNKDIAPDEVVQDVATGYDAKRDRWNGYDPAEHKHVYEEYAAVEAARQKLREEEIDKRTTTDLAAVRKVAKAGTGKEKGEGRDDDFGSSDEEDEDQDKYAESADAVGQKLDTKTRITVRNLRIREDTAKYLINLDPSSAYYDPKTRSMRDNPNVGTAPEEVRSLFILLSCHCPSRQSSHNSRERTSCGIPEKPPKCKSSSSSHGMLQPAAMMSMSMRTPRRVNSSTRSIFRRKKSSRIQLKSASSPSTAERSTWRRHQRSCYRGKRRSTLNIRGPVKLSKARNGRRRDRSTQRMVSPLPPVVCLARLSHCLVFVNNHTAVWGSWYDPASGTWGYACCHSSVHMSYCTGDAGIDAARASSAKHLLESSSSALMPPPPVPSGDADERKKKAEELFSKKRLGEGNLSLDEGKLAKALNEERKRKARGDDDDDRFGKKQRGGPGQSYEVSEEELGTFTWPLCPCFLLRMSVPEAYRMNRRMMDDPMANYVDTDA